MSHRQAVVVSVDPRRVYVTSRNAPEAGVSCVNISYLFEDMTTTATFFVERPLKL